MRCEPGELPLPEKELHQVGGEGPYGRRGPRQLRLLEHHGLTPSCDVLEIGCGLGRLAYELASYLDDDATYTGFDIAAAPIEWLNEHYAPRLPGFRFDLLDVTNERYRPDGATAPEAIRFPYPDSTYDVVCAFEVFMHMSLDGVRNYIDEIARVLRPAGLAVVTFMAIYPDEHEPRHAGRPFVALGGGVHTRFPDRSGTSMGYDVGLIEELLASAGFGPPQLTKGRWHTPYGGIGPLSHGCDLFATQLLTAP